MKVRKTFRNIAQYIPQVLVLLSILISNVLFPAVAIAEEISDLQSTNTQVQDIPVDESEDILDEGIATSIYDEVVEEEADEPLFVFEDGIYTVNTVVEGEEYVYPDNSDVRITFNEVTEDGNLVIKRVVLTEEEKELLNTSDDYGWDISSSMSNGSFKYDLTLPNTQGNDVEVKYTEDGTNYESVDNEIVNENVIEIKGLEHFTTFVVVPAGTIPEEVTEGTTEVDSTCNVSSGGGMYCYDTIQEAVTVTPSGEEIIIQPGDHVISSQLVINKNLTIKGVAADTTKIIPGFSTGNTGDERGWILVNNNAKVTISNLTFDGSGYNIFQSIRANAADSLNLYNISFKNISYGQPYLGFAVAYMDTDGVIQNISFENIQRVGLTVYDKSDLDVTNLSYIGKGDGNWLDYAIEVGGGGHLVLTGASISNCRGVATSDGSTSAGILVTTYYGGGSTANIEHTNFKNNSLGLAVGYDSVDTSTVEIHNSDFSNNDSGVSSTKPQVNATNCKWNSSKQSEILAFNEGDVLIDPWYGKTVTQEVTVNEYEKGGIYYVKLNDILNFNIAGEPVYGQHYITGLWGYNSSTGSRTDDRYIGWVNINPDSSDLINVDKDWNMVTDHWMGSNAPGTTIPAGDYLLWVERYYDEGVYVSGSTVTKRVTIDNTKPVLSVLTPTADERINGPVDISITASDSQTDISSVSMHIYKVEGASKTLVAGCTSIPTTFDGTNWNATINNGGSCNLVEGTYEIAAWAYDGVQNPGWATRVQFVIDETAPAAPTGLHILDYEGNALGCEGFTSNRSITVDWNDNPEDDIAYYRYDIKDKDNLSQPTNSEFSGNIRDQDGDYQYRVWAVDKAGNVSNQSSGWCGITLDREAPEQPTGLERRNLDGEVFACGDTAQRQTMIPDWNDITNDPSFSHFEYSSFNADGSQGLNEQVLYVSEFVNNWTAQVDGTYGFAVRSVDKAGNKSEWSLNGETLENGCQITYDSVAPEVYLTSPTDGLYTQSTSVLQTWDTTATDVDHYEYRSCWNDPTNEVCDLIYSTTRTTKSRTVNNNNITFWWQVRGIDIVGNEGEWSEAWKMTIDGIAPLVEITSHEDSDWIRGSTTIKGYASDINLSHYWFVIQNAVLGNTVAGLNTVHTTSSPAFINYLWDTNSLPDGEYIAKLEARDKADNKDPNQSPILNDPEIVGDSVDWVILNVDNTPPTQPVITNSPNNSYTNVNAITINWTDGDDTGSHPSGIRGYILGYEFISADGGNTITWNTGLKEVGNPYTHSGNYGEGEGTYIFYVKTVDNAGNESPVSDTFTITYDSTSPEITLELPTDEEIYSGGIELRAVCNEECDYINFWWRAEGEEYSNQSPNRRYHYIYDNGTTFEWTLDTLEAELWGDDGTYVMSDGTYYFYAAGKDVVGNWAKSDEIQVTVDNTSPVTILTDNSYTYTNQPILIEGESTDLHGVDYVDLFYSEAGQNNWLPLTTIDNTNDNSPFTWSYSWTPGAEGVYDVKAEATDTVGNQENSPIIYAITYDKTPPDIKLIDIIDGLLNITTEDILSGTKTVEIKIDNGQWIIYTPDMNLNELVNNQPGTYTVYIRVTDKAGNTVEDMTQFTIAQPPAEDEGDVAGATDKRVVYTTTLGTGSGSELLNGEDEEDTTTEETTTDEEVLGEETQTCDNPIEVRGYIYLDKNKDDIRDGNEKGIAGVSIRTYYIDEENNEITIDTLTTNEEGYWETNLCPGDYYMAIDQETLPENLETSDVIEVQIADDLTEPVEFNISATDMRNFWQKYWYIVLIVGALLFTTAYIIITGSRKEQQQYTQ